MKTSTFWDNILRYPKFFLSSMLGLLLIITSPFYQLFKDFNNKKMLFLFLAFAGIGFIGKLLSLMLDL